MKKDISLRVVLSVLALLVACAAPTPQVIKETVKETVVVGGTPQVVEKVVEKVVTLTPAPGQNLVTLDACVGTEPPTLDPALATDSTSIWFIRQMFVGLLGFNEKAEVVPALATEWKASADGLKWTYKMRTDVPWVAYNPGTGQVTQVVDSNKKPVMVTARDVEYGVKRTLNPRYASQYSYVLYTIKGGEAFNTADFKKLTEADIKKLEDAVGVKALDDSTVEFTLTSPAGFFPAITAMWVTFPQYAPIIAQKGDRWSEPGMIVTNGPYTLKEWAHQSRIAVLKNPFWPDAKNVQIEVIQGPIITSESTCMQMYEKGEIDMMSYPGWDVPLPDRDRVRKDPKLSKELYIKERMSTYYYGFLNTRKPFDNPLVRKALSAAIDRRTLVETVTKGGERPAHTFIAPGLFGSTAEDMTIAPYLLDYKDGLAKAKDWMKQAGYPDGQGLSVRLGHNVSEAHAQIAQAIQAMWKQAFPKADIRIETQDWAVFLKTLAPTAPDAEKPDVYRMSWNSDYPDANNWVNEVFGPQSGQNYAKYKNDKFTELVLSAAVESDPAKRIALYKQAEQIFIDQDMGIAPIYHPTFFRVFKPYLTEHPLNPVTGDPVSTWKLDWAAKTAARGGK